MQDREIQQHLSDIATHWSMLRQAHGGAADEAAAARQVLMERYCGAVFRYLLRRVRDASVAEDLTQEFALRFIQGRFEKADRERGRFRDYVRGALFRLVQDHYREQARGPRSVALEHDPVGHDEQAAADQAFRESWRQELLARAWRALEQEASQPFYAVLRLRADQPELTGGQMAELLTARLGRDISAANLRQLLHRARERFADLLLDDIRQSLEDAPPERIAEELAELNLLKYCKDALAKRQG
jgi:RNA polymerase sigma factor (sigma-70 family)